MGLIIGGVDFGKRAVLSAGSMNFFGPRDSEEKTGQGWPFHKKFKKWFKGFRGFEKAIFTAKTTTIDQRDGHLPLDEDLQPKEKIPECLYVTWLTWLRGFMLNSVGLSGPGAHRLLKKGMWQKITDPFIISFMPVKDNPEEYSDEMRRFVDLLKEFLPRFGTKIALEINLSCPNTGRDTKKLINKAAGLLGIARELGIPLILKVNVLIGPETVKNIVDQGLCDAITVSNTIPYGEAADKINWRWLFFSKISPLYKKNPKFGGGGLSGKPLLKPTADWIKRARACGIKIQIIAGGGVLSKRDIRILAKAGASAIFISSVLLLRPWRVNGLIDYANHYLEECGYDKQLLAA